MDSDIGKIDWVRLTPVPPVVGQNLIMKSSVHLGKTIIQNGDMINQYN